MTTPEVSPPAVTEVGRWRGPLVTEGVFTGDDRFFQPGSIEWDEQYLPFALRWAPADFGAHDGAVHVAWINSVTRDGDQLWGEGPVFDQKFMDYLNRAGKAGVSVDCDTGTYTVEIVEPTAMSIESVDKPVPGVEYGVPRMIQRYQGARLRGATVVDFGAFIGAFVAPDTEEAMAAAYVTLQQAIDAAEPTPVDSETGITHAGLALQALDTGRVLMVQRCLDDPADPAAGKWEFPGGGIDDGEDEWAAAQREFAEEVGHELVDGCEPYGTHDFANYRLHVVPVQHEADQEIDGRTAVNPDGHKEATAWWSLEDIPGNTMVRQEVLDNHEVVLFPAGATQEEPMTAAVEDAPHGEMPDVPTEEPAQDVDLETVGAAISQAKALLQGHMDGSIPDNSASQQTLLDLLTTMEQIVCPPEPPVDEATEFDALIASAAPVAPPDEWFEPFDLDGPTPLTVTADGRVFGHLATWDSCHRSGQYSNKCVKPPSDPNAPYFQTGQVLTASGNLIDVGRITVGGGHAAGDLGLVAAIEHYDDVSATTAVVALHEDEFGIGLFGAAVPEATPEQIAAMRRSPLSGDWRKEKGAWRVIAAHAVNVGGFPIPRGLVASVAPDSFITYGRVEPKAPDPHAIDLRATAQRLARSAGLDTASLVASTRQVMSDVDCNCDDEEPALVASLVGDTTLPVAGYDLGWDGGAAAARVFEHFTTGETVDVDGVAKAFLWRNEVEPADQKAGYDLPFADIVDGELMIIPRGVQACAGGHGVGQLNATDEEKASIKERIGDLYIRVQTVYPEAPSNPFEKAVV